MKSNVYIAIVCGVTAILVIVYVQQRTAIHGLRTHYQQLQEEQRQQSTYRRKTPDGGVAAEVAAAAVETMTSDNRANVELAALPMDDKAGGDIVADTNNAVRLIEEQLAQRDPPEKLQILDEAWRARYVELSRDPKRKAMMEAAWTIQMDASYAPLFRVYDLSADQLAYFKSLLVGKKSLNDTFAIEKAAPGTTLGLRLDAEYRRQGGQGELDNLLLSFLGSDGFAEFKGFEASQPEREMISNYFRTLQNIGMSLEDYKQDVVIRAMYDERMNSNRMRDLMEGGDVLTDFTEDSLRELIREFDDWTLRVRNRSRPVLNVKQQALLEKHLVLQRDIFLVRLTTSQLF